jgi:aspartate carbamoyltransferase catalytic subunit
MSTDEVRTELRHVQELADDASRMPRGEEFFDTLVTMQAYVDDLVNRTSDDETDNDDDAEPVGRVNVRFSSDDDD